MGAMKKKAVNPDFGLKMKPRKALPFEFVLEALGSTPITTRAMFGCHAIYVGEKVVLMLRQKEYDTDDNGVWIATKPEHHESLRREFPHLRPIRLMGGKIASFQNLPAEAPDFEEAAVRACELIRAKDARIGNVPKRKQKQK
jgi:hypothetical protein